MDTFIIILILILGKTLIWVSLFNFSLNPFDEVAHRFSIIFVVQAKQTKYLQLTTETDFFIYNVTGAFLLFNDFINKV